MEEKNERAMLRTKRNMKTKRHLNRAKDYFPQALMSFAVLAAVLILYYLLKKLPVIGGALKSITKALSPALCGFVFAFIMSPIVGWLENKLLLLRCKSKSAHPEDEEWLMKSRRRMRALSIIITLIFTLSMITVILITVIPEFVDSVSGLIPNINDYVQQIQDYIDSFLARNPRLDATVSQYSAKISKAFGDWVTSHLTDFTSKATDAVTDSVKFIVRLLYNWLIGTIVSVYLLMSKEYYIGLCKKILFSILPKKTSKNTIQTLHRANQIYTAAIFGKIVDSLIIGMLCFIGSTILGIFFPEIGSYSILLSVLVGVTNVIPFFGPFLGGVPCCLLLFCLNPICGLVFAAFLVVLQQFDCNYLDPHIVGKKVGLRPLYVLCACMLGSGLFGVAGLIVATPTCALIYYLMKSALEVRLESKNLPKETKEYIISPGAVIANKSMSEDTLTERLVAESYILDEADEAEEEDDSPEEEQENRKKRKRKPRNNHPKNEANGEETEKNEDSELFEELDLSAFDDKETARNREQRLEREWLMSTGEPDANENGIADRLEEKLKDGDENKGRVTLFERMVSEAEEDVKEYKKRLGDDDDSESDL